MWEWRGGGTGAHPPLTWRPAALLAALLAAVVLQASGAASPALSDESHGRVVCYYANWSPYRRGSARFEPANINPHLCTHLVYAFASFTKDNQLKPFDKYQDIDLGGYTKFNNLKTYNKNLKTLVAIGGWNEGSARFSKLVASAQRRTEFSKNIIKFLRQNKFDGLDLDWEYPAFREGGKPKDRENYANFVQELSEEFQKEADAAKRTRLLLTMAVPAGIDYIDKGFDIKKLNRYVDWFNVLLYDYHSAYEGRVAHHAPLYNPDTSSLDIPEEYRYDEDDRLNVDFTINHYLSAGALASKLVVGFPTYGRSYTLPVDPSVLEDVQEVVSLGSPAQSPGTPGPFTKEKGYLSYYEICANVKGLEKKVKSAGDDDDDEEQKKWTVVQPNPRAVGPFAYGGDQWVGYDDIDMVRRKAEYVADKKLGGIMVWSLDNDDFHGSCHGKPFPLVEAAKSALYQRLGIQQITSGFTTPPPPTTPSSEPEFKCEDEGFYANPKDCKKYFWCLESNSDLGLIAHHFTCPSGLHFNVETDSCDFKRNVKCSVKKGSSVSTTPSTTTTTTTAPQSNQEQDPSSTSRPIRLPRPGGATLSTRPPLTQIQTSTTTARPRPQQTGPVSNRTNIFNRRRPSTAPPIIISPIIATEGVEDVTTGFAEEKDPKVIKELVALLKKLGGVEQLEKYLESRQNTDGNDSLTQVSKEFFSLTGATKVGSGRQINTNSGGAQNSGLDQITEVKNIRKERPRYTSINRFRSTTEATTPELSSTASSLSSVSRFRTSSQFTKEEESGEEESSVTESSSRNSSPRYVNIRRNRPTTTEPTITESELTNRYRSEDADREPTNSQTEVQTQTHTFLRHKPQYQTIVRNRGPSVTQETEVEIDNLVDEVIDNIENSENEEEPFGNTGIKYTDIIRGQTSASTFEEEKEGGSSRFGSETPSNTKYRIKPEYKTIQRGRSTPAPDTAPEIVASVLSTSITTLKNSAIVESYLSETDEEPVLIKEETTTARVEAETTTTEVNVLKQSDVSQEVGEKKLVTRKRIVFRRPVSVRPNSRETTSDERISTEENSKEENKNANLETTTAAPIRLKAKEIIKSARRQHATRITATRPTSATEKSVTTKAVTNIRVRPGFRRRLPGQTTTPPTEQGVKEHNINYSENINDSTESIISRTARRRISRIKERIVNKANENETQTSNVTEENKSVTTSNISSLLKRRRGERNQTDLHHTTQPISSQSLENTNKQNKEDVTVAISTEATTDYSDIQWVTATDVSKNVESYILSYPKGIKQEMQEMNQTSETTLTTITIINKNDTVQPKNDCNCSEKIKYYEDLLSSVLSKNQTNKIINSDAAKTETMDAIGNITITVIKEIIDDHLSHSSNSIGALKEKVATDIAEKIINTSNIINEHSNRTHNVNPISRTRAYDNIFTSSQINNNTSQKDNKHIQNIRGRSKIRKNQIVSQKQNEESNIQVLNANKENKIILNIQNQQNKTVSIVTNGHSIHFAGEVLTGEDTVSNNNERKLVNVGEGNATQKGRYRTIKRINHRSDKQNDSEDRNDIEKIDIKNSNTSLIKSLLSNETLANSNIEFIKFDKKITNKSSVDIANRSSDVIQVLLDTAGNSVEVNNIHIVNQENNSQMTDNSLKSEILIKNQTIEKIDTKQHKGDNNISQIQGSVVTYITEQTVAESKSQLPSESVIGETDNSANISQAVDDKIKSNIKYIKSETESKSNLETTQSNVRDGDTAETTTEIIIITSGIVNTSDRVYNKIHNSSESSENNDTTSYLVYGASDSSQTIKDDSEKEIEINSGSNISLDKTILISTDIPHNDHTEIRSIGNKSDSSNNLKITDEYFTNIISGAEGASQIKSLDEAKSSISATNLSEINDRKSVTNIQHVLIKSAEQYSINNGETTASKTSKNTGVHHGHRGSHKFHGDISNVHSSDLNSFTVFTGTNEELNKNNDNINQEVATGGKVATSTSGNKIYIVYGGNSFKNISSQKITNEDDANKFQLTSKFEKENENKISSISTVIKSGEDATSAANNNNLKVEESQSSIQNIHTTGNYDKTGKTNVSHRGRGRIRKITRIIQRGQEETNSNTNSEQSNLKNQTDTRKSDTILHRGRQRSRGGLSKTHNEVISISDSENSPKVDLTENKTTSTNSVDSVFFSEINTTEAAFNLQLKTSEKSTNTSSVSEINSDEKQLGSQDSGNAITKANEIVLIIVPDTASDIETHSSSEHSQSNDHKSETGKKLSTESHTSSTSAPSEIVMISKGSVSSTKSLDTSMENKSTPETKKSNIEHSGNTFTAARDLVLNFVQSSESIMQDINSEKEAESHSTSAGTSSETVVISSKTGDNSSRTAQSERVANIQEQSNNDVSQSNNQASGDFKKNIITINKEDSEIKSSIPKNSASDNYILVIKSKDGISSNKLQLSQKHDGQTEPNIEQPNVAKSTAFIDIGTVEPAQASIDRAAVSTSNDIRVESQSSVENSKSTDKLLNTGTLSFTTVDRSESNIRNDKSRVINTDDNKNVHGERVIRKRINHSDNIQKLVPREPVVTNRRTVHNRGAHKFHGDLSNVHSSDLNSFAVGTVEQTQSNQVVEDTQQRVPAISEQAIANLEDKIYIIYGQDVHSNGSLQNITSKTITNTEDSIFQTEEEKEYFNKISSSFSDVVKEMQKEHTLGNNSYKSSEINSSNNNNVQGSETTEKYVIKIITTAGESKNQVKSTDDATTAKDSENIYNIQVEGSHGLHDLNENVKKQIIEEANTHRGRGRARKLTHVQGVQQEINSNQNSEESNAKMETDVKISDSPFRRGTKISRGGHSRTKNIDKTIGDSENNSKFIVKANEISSINTADKVNFSESPTNEDKSNIQNTKSEKSIDTFTKTDSNSDAKKLSNEVSANAVTDTNEITVIIIPDTTNVIESHSIKEHSQISDQKSKNETELTNESHSSSTSISSETVVISGSVKLEKSIETSTDTKTDSDTKKSETPAGKAVLIILPEITDSVETRNISEHLQSSTLNIQKIKSGKETESDSTSRRSSSNTVTISADVSSEKPMKTSTDNKANSETKKSNNKDSENNVATTKEIVLIIVPETAGGNKTHTNSEHSQSSESNIQNIKSENKAESRSTLASASSETVVITSKTEDSGIRTEQPEGVVNIEKQSGSNVSRSNGEISGQYLVNVFTIDQGASKLESSKLKNSGSLSDMLDVQSSEEISSNKSKSFQKDESETESNIQQPNKAKSTEYINIGVIQMPYVSLDKATASTANDISEESQRNSDKSQSIDKSVTIGAVSFTTIDRPELNIRNDESRVINTEDNKNVHGGRVTGKRINHDDNIQNVAIGTPVITNRRIVHNRGGLKFHGDLSNVHSSDLNSFAVGTVNQTQSNQIVDETQQNVTASSEEHTANLGEKIYIIYGQDVHSDALLQNVTSETKTNTEDLILKTERENEYSNKIGSSSSSVVEERPSEHTLDNDSSISTETSSSSNNNVQGSEATGEYVIKIITTTGESKNQIKSTDDATTAKSSENIYNIHAEESQDNSHNNRNTLEESVTNLNENDKQQNIEETNMTHSGRGRFRKLTHVLRILGGHLDGQHEINSKENNDRNNGNIHTNVKISDTTLHRGKQRSRRVHSGTKHIDKIINNIENSSTVTVTANEISSTNTSNSARFTESKATEDESNNQNLKSEKSIDSSTNNDSNSDSKKLGYEASVNAVTETNEIVAIFIPGTTNVIETHDGSKHLQPRAQKSEKETELNSTESQTSSDSTSAETVAILTNSVSSKKTIGTYTETKSNLETKKSNDEDSGNNDLITKELVLIIEPETLDNVQTSTEYSQTSESSIEHISSDKKTELRSSSATTSSKTILSSPSIIDNTADTSIRTAQARGVVIIEKQNGSNLSQLNGGISGEYLLNGIKIDQRTSQIKSNNLNKSGSGSDIVVVHSTDEITSSKSLSSQKDESQADLNIQQLNEAKSSASVDIADIQGAQVPIESTVVSAANNTHIESQSNIENLQSSDKSQVINTEENKKVNRGRLTGKRINNNDNVQSVIIRQPEIDHHKSSRHHLRGTHKFRGDLSHVHISDLKAFATKTETQNNNNIVFGGTNENNAVITDTASTSVDDSVNNVVIRAGETEQQREATATKNENEVIKSGAYSARKTTSDTLSESNNIGSQTESNIQQIKEATSLEGIITTTGAVANSDARVTQSNDVTNNKVSGSNLKQLLNESYDHLREIVSYGKKTRIESSINTSSKEAPIDSSNINKTVVIWIHANDANGGFHNDTQNDTLVSSKSDSISGEIQSIVSLKTTDYSNSNDVTKLTKLNHEDISRIQSGSRMLKNQENSNSDNIEESTAKNQNNAEAYVIVDSAAVVRKDEHNIGLDESSNIVTVTENDVVSGGSAFKGGKNVAVELGLEDVNNSDEIERENGKRITVTHFSRRIELPDLNVKDYSNQKEVEQSKLVEIVIPEVSKDTTILTESPKESAAAASIAVAAHRLQSLQVGGNTDTLKITKHQNSRRKETSTRHPTIKYTVPERNSPAEPAIGIPAPNSETDYEYYDESEPYKYLDSRPYKNGVIIHNKGIVKCLQQGNFPYAGHCNKFISCVRYLESDHLRGYVYTCPPGLFYDPVGEICNWSSGCKDDRV